MFLPALTTNLEDRLIADVGDLRSSMTECYYLTEWELTTEDCVGCFMVEICLWASPSTHIRCSCNYPSVNNLCLCIWGFSTSPSAEACLLSEVSQNPGPPVCTWFLSIRDLFILEIHVGIDVVPDYLIQSPPGCLLAADNTASKAHPLTSSWSWKVCSLTTAK